MDDHQVLLSTCENNKPSAVNLWDHRTKNSLFQYKNGGPIGRHLIDQINNDYLIGANPEEPKLYLWPVNKQDVSNKCQLIVPDRPSCLSVHPRGHYVAVGIKTNMYIWQLCSGQLLTINKKNMHKITVIKFSGCENFIIVGDESGKISTYMLVNLVSFDKNDISHREVGKTEPVYSRSDHTDAILDIYVAVFGKRTKMGSCSLDQTVKIYELWTGNLLHNFVIEHVVYVFLADFMFYEGFIGCSNGIVVTFNIAQASKNHHLTSEEIKEKELYFKGLKKSVKCLALDHTGNILAAAGDDGLIILWDRRSKQNLSTIKVNSPVTNLKFIINHQNIWTQDYIPKTSITHFERNLNIRSISSGALIAPAGSVKRNNNPSEEEIEDTSRQNTYLRATNHQMYKAYQDLLKQFIKQ